MLDAREYCKVVRWLRMQASSLNSQGVIDGEIDEVGMGTATSDGSAVLFSLMHQG